MARDHARVKTSRWSDSDWRDLSQGAQWLYDFFLTHPRLSFAGVADWRPNRIAAMALDLGAGDVRDAGAELEAARFLVLDEDTEEALIRTWVRHDELLRSPNMAVAMVREFGDIASAKLREAFLTELRRLREDSPELRGWGPASVLLGRSNPSANPPGNPSGKGSPNPSGDPSPNPSGKGSNPFGNPSGNPSPTPAPTPAPAPAAAAATRASPEQPPLQPPVDNSKPDLPVALGILKAALEARKLFVRWDQLSPERVQTIERLIELHGDGPLVAAAIRSHRPDRPAAFAQAWIGVWESLPEPGSRLRVVDPRCDRHTGPDGQPQKLKHCGCDWTDQPITRTQEAHA